MDLHRQITLRSILLLAALSSGACAKSAGSNDPQPQQQEQPDAGPSLPTEPPTSWEQAGALNVPRYMHTMTLLKSGSVLVTGGFNATAGLITSAEVYYPDTNEWTEVGSMAVGRGLHTATLLPDGRVLVAGGGLMLANGYPSGNQTTAEAELFEEKSGQFSSAAPMNEARTNHTAVLLDDGRVLVAGGCSSRHDHQSPDGVSDALASAELYDPRTNTWTMTGSMAQARASHTAVKVASGKVLVVGGFDETGATYQSAELYDPESGTWSTAASLPGEARAFHGAALLHDDRVIVTGGLMLRNVRSGHWLADAMVYDAKTGSWTNAPGLGAARDMHVTVVLPSGHVLVAAGTAQSGQENRALQDVVIYSPNATTAVAGAPLSSPRQAGKGIALKSGEVLIAGGIGESYFVSDCEVSTH